MGITTRPIPGRKSATPSPGRIDLSARESMTLTDFNSMWYGVLVIGAVGLVYALATALWIGRADPGNDRMREIAGAIRTGAMAFLAREYRMLAVFVVVVAIILALALSVQLAVAFVTGAVLSILAGNLGMRIATLANVRAAWAVKSDQIGRASCRERV